MFHTNIKQAFHIKPHVQWLNVMTVQAHEMNWISDCQLWEWPHGGFSTRPFSTEWLWSYELSSSTSLVLSADLAQFAPVAVFACGNPVTVILVCFWADSVPPRRFSLPLPLPPPPPPSGCTSCKPLAWVSLAGLAHVRRIPVCVLKRKHFRQDRSMLKYLKRKRSIWGGGGKAHRGRDPPSSHAGNSQRVICQLRKLSYLILFFLSVSSNYKLHI